MVSFNLRYRQSFWLTFMSFFTRVSKVQYITAFRELGQIIEQAVEQHLWTPVKYLEDFGLLRVPTLGIIGLGIKDQYILVVRKPIDDILKCLEENVDPSPTRSETVQDVVIVAHGSIAQQLVSLPKLKRTKAIMLYTPWNCALDYKAASRIISGEMKPEDRDFICYLRGSSGGKQANPTINPGIPAGWNTILGDKRTCASDTSDGTSVEVTGRHSCNFDKTKIRNIFLKCGLCLDSKRPVESNSQANSQTPSAKSSGQIGQPRDLDKIPDILLSSVSNTDMGKLQDKLNIGEISSSLENQQKYFISEDTRILLCPSIEFKPYDRCRLSYTFEHELRWLDVLNIQRGQQCNVHLASCLDSVNQNKEIQAHCEKQYAVASNGAIMTIKKELHSEPVHPWLEKILEWIFPSTN